MKHQVGGGGVADRIDGPVREDDPATARGAAHRHFKMYKPAKVLTQFVFNHRKRRRRRLLGDVARSHADNDDDDDGDNDNHFSFPNGTMAIGRLDEDSEGLLLLTTDGRVSERVRRRSVEKEYWAQVDSEVSEGALERLRRGVEIRCPSSSSPSPEPYLTMPCEARRLETESVKCENDADGTKGKCTTRRDAPTRRKKFKGRCNACGEMGHKSRDCIRNAPQMAVSKASGSGEAPSRLSLPPGLPPPSRNGAARRPTSWISLTIREGRNRQVRRMTAAVGHPTLRLVRVRIGAVGLDGMTPGEVRAWDASDYS